MLNSVALMGRLVYDPELRTTPQGTSMCSFRLAVDRSFEREAAASSSPELTPTDEPTPFDPPPEPAPEQTSLSGGQMYSGEELKDYAPRTSQAAASAGPAVGTPEADAMIDDGADDLPF